MHPENGLIFPSPPDELKRRMMVAEYVGRGQSGSPVNGEIPQLNSNMPASHGREMLVSTTPGDEHFPSGNYNMSSVKHKELFSQRKQREFTPENKKDDSYWDRRRRNNEAAKRSREKRRFNDMVLEQRVVELTKENAILKAQLEAIKEEYGICGESVVCVEKVLATLPSNEQVLSLTKRQKVAHSNQMMFGPPSPIPTPLLHPPVLSGGSPPPPLQHPSHNMLQTPISHLEPAFREHSDLHSHNYAFPYHHHHHSPMHHYESNNALNLSRTRSRSRNQSPFEVCSNSGDETTTTPPTTFASSDANNSLPLKLRHKSHLGDKDAASALLSLQNIKQEPEPRASPLWDGEGSSDERDSGISLGVEWSAATQAATTLQTLQKQSQLAALRESDSDTTTTNANTKRRLHSEIFRLTTELENLKSMVNKDKTAPAH